MREFLFKGFHPDDKGIEKICINGKWIKGFWVYGYYEKEKMLNKKEYNYFIVEEDVHKDRYKNMYKVIPETIKQSTGLMDKNKNQIFDSDICIFENYLGIVEYDNEDAMFTFTYDENICTNFSAIWGTELEVIGNVYSNPDLLKDNM